MARIVRLYKHLAPLAELALMQGREPTGKEEKTWVLGSPAVFIHEGTKVVVPEAFMTDFASIPWVFRWWQQGSVGPQRIAGVFHDWLYSEQSSLTRKHCDLIFRLVMQEAGRRKNKFARARNWFRRWAMYTALRIGGYFAWRSNQKKLREMGHGWRILK